MAYPRRTKATNSLSIIKGTEITKLNSQSFFNNKIILSYDRSFPPLGGEVRPLGWKVRPLGRRVRPLGGEVRPLGRRVRPLGREVPPLGRRVRPLGRKLRPLGRNPISLNYKSIYKKTK